MACITGSCGCKPCNTNKSCVSCLGRCYLPKHKCETKREIRPGPVPKCMGWDYTAKNAPEHQLKCGWRPGHISYPVLNKIEAHYCITTCGSRGFGAGSNKSGCPKRSCPSSSCIGPKCMAKVASGTKTGCAPAPCTLPCCVGPSIRIIRHNGTYTIATKPDDMETSPSGASPLKYVLNTAPDEDDDKKKKTSYSIEAKFNDNQFDYVSSNTSFVLDFLPPCGPPCSAVCNGSCSRKPSCPGINCL